MKSSVQINSKVEAEGFRLVLPQALKFTPEWTIELPRKWKAEIYKFDDVELNKNGNPLLDADGNPIKGTKYNVVMRSPSGKISKDGRFLDGYRYRGTYNVFQDLFDMSMWLRNVAEVLSIKKKTRTSKEVDEPEYEDDGGGVAIIVE